VYFQSGLNRHTKKLIHKWSEADLVLCIEQVEDGVWVVVLLYGMFLACHQLAIGQMSK
jgi:hypothetical protein